MNQNLTHKRKRVRCFHRFLRNAGDDGDKLVSSGTIVEYRRKASNFLDEDGSVKSVEAQDYPTAFNKFQEFAGSEWDCGVAA